MKYKLIHTWLDTEKNELHTKLGEIIEMEDEARGANLVRLGAFEEVVEEPVEEKPKAEKPKAEKPKTTSRKKK